jgi:hypothetical protein
MDILHMRLQNQRLLDEKFETVADAVTWLGAVQSQDFPAAKWSLGQRVSGATDEDIMAAYNEGAILRTHVLRPTWHFVMPQDIRWMLQLTAPRVKRMMLSSNRKLELDNKLLTKSVAIIRGALEKDTYLTRQEIKVSFTKAGIETDVQRLAHIVMNAELDGLVCSGPQRGKQFTYALLESRAPNAKVLDHDEACVELAWRYFRSHGPAQVKDFVWWSGLSRTDAEQAVAVLGSRLMKTEVGERVFYASSETSHMSKPEGCTAHLLSIYDENTIAYTDRSDLSAARDIERMIKMGNALTAIVLLDGVVSGTWKRQLKKNSVIIRLSLFRVITPAEKEALEKAAQAYTAFLGLATFEIINA